MGDKIVGGLASRGHLSCICSEQLRTCSCVLGLGYSSHIYRQASSEDRRRGEETVAKSAVDTSLRLSWYQVGPADVSS